MNLPRKDGLALVADIGGTNARFALTDLHAPQARLQDSSRCATRSSRACNTPRNTTCGQSACSRRVPRSQWPAR